MLRFRGGAHRRLKRDVVHPKTLVAFRFFLSSRLIQTVIIPSALNAMQQRCYGSFRITPKCSQNFGQTEKSCGEALKYPSWEESKWILAISPTLIHSFSFGHAARACTGPRKGGTSQDTHRTAQTRKEQAGHLADRDNVMSTRSEQIEVSPRNIASRKQPRGSRRTAFTRPSGPCPGSPSSLHKGRWQGQGGRVDLNKISASHYDMRGPGLPAE